MKLSLHGRSYGGTSGTGVPTIEKVPAKKGPENLFLVQNLRRIYDEFFRFWTLLSILTYEVQKYGPFYLIATLKVQKSGPYKPVAVLEVQKSGPY